MLWVFLLKSFKLISIWDPGGWRKSPDHLFWPKIVLILSLLLSYLLFLNLLLFSVSAMLSHLCFLQFFFLIAFFSTLCFLSCVSLFLFVSSFKGRPDLLTSAAGIEGAKPGP